MPIKNSSKNDKKSIKGPPVPVKINEKTKEAYLVTIRELEYKLSRYQTKHEQLTESINYFESQFEKISNEENNTIKVMSDQLEIKTQKHVELVRTINELQETIEANHVNYEQQIQQLKNEYKQTKEDILTKNTKMTCDLQLLEEFRLKKKEIILKAEELERQLQNNLESNLVEIQTLENKCEEAIVGLKLKAIEASKEAGNNFRIQTEIQMPATLKRTLHENVSIGRQISNLNEVQLDIESENKNLKKQLADNRKSLKDMESNEIELTTKLIAVKKIVKMMEMKLANTKYT